MSWEKSRQHYAVIRQMTGYYIAIPAVPGDSIIYNEIDWAVATNMSKKANAVVRFLGPTNIAQQKFEGRDLFDRLVGAYDGLLSKGLVEEIEILPEPKPTADDLRQRRNYFIVAGAIAISLIAVLGSAQSVYDFELPTWMMLPILLPALAVGIWALGPSFRRWPGQA